MPRRQRASQRTRTTKRYRDDLRQFGLRVRYLRTTRTMTIERAAEMMDLDPAHLAKIEAGRINVSFVTLVRIAHGLGVDLVALFEVPS